MIRSTVLLAILIALAVPGTAPAQSLGTFRWQLQPYCNVVTVSVIQNGGLYRLDRVADMALQHSKPQPRERQGGR